MRRLHAEQVLLTPAGLTARETGYRDGFTGADFSWKQVPKRERRNYAIGYGYGQCARRHHHKEDT